MRFRKRTLEPTSVYPRNAVVSIWMPLIHRIESLHVGFITTLAKQMTLQLLNEPAVQEPGTSSARDSSYDSFIAAWVVYLLDTQTLSADEVASRGLITGANIIQAVIGGLGPFGLSTLSERKT